MTGPERLNEAAVVQPEPHIAQPRRRACADPRLSYPDLREAARQQKRKVGWQYRSTIGFCISFLGVGLMPGTYGPTVPALAQRLGLAHPGELAPTFIMRGICYGVGTLLGGLLVERVGNAALVLWAAAAIVMSGCGAMVPYGVSLVPVALLVGGMSLAGGIVDVLGNVLIIKLWLGDDKRGAPSMNMLHASWSMGATVAPALAAAIGLESSKLPLIYGVAASFSAASGLAPLLLGGQPPARKTISEPLAATDQARAMSEICISTAGPCDDDATAPPAAIAPHLGDDKGDQTKAVSQEKSPRGRFILVMSCMFVFYVCLGAAERVPGDWLTAAVARSDLNGASEEAGAFATSVFFGAHLAGRLFSVPLSWMLPTTQMLKGSFSLAAVSALLMLTLGQQDYSFLCVSLGGLGLGISALYPFGILLAKERVLLSSAWISRLAFGALFGDVIMPPLVGALIAITPTSFYLAEAAVVFLQMIAFFLVAWIPPAKGIPAATLPSDATTPIPAAAPSSDPALEKKPRQWTSQRPAPFVSPMSSGWWRKCLPPLLKRHGVRALKGTSTPIKLPTSI